MQRVLGEEFSRPSRRSHRLCSIVPLCLCLTACGASTQQTPPAAATPTPAPTPSGPAPEATILCGHNDGLRWVSTAPLMSAIPDTTHALVSIKDPSVVFFDGRWHVYATSADTSGAWSMVYLSFTDWPEAAAAKPYYLDANPGLRGYHCAPQVFYFRPQKKWYLIFQSQQPQYSTADDLSRPETWSQPQNFFSNKPASVVGTWIDYWVICDETRAYLFFTNDAGYFYRSQTSLDSFPAGFSEPVLVMRDPDRARLFEAGHIYRLKGTSQYLALIEAMGVDSRRYYRAFVASQLDGGWTPALNTNSWEWPLAGSSNVSFEGTSAAWTKDISHGELLRDGYDETLTVDPCNLRFLYQGYDPARGTTDYSQLPWRLALLRLAP
jgi:Glycosyl hydrolase family 62